MKKIHVYTLAALAVVLLTACGSDNPVTPADRDGKIFLENGTLYAATTNFTENQLVDILTGIEAWVESGHIYYDKNHASSFLSSAQADAPSFAPATVYAFGKEGTVSICNEMNTDDKIACTYTIDGKLLLMTLDTDYSRRLVVVAADNDRIVVDSKYVYAGVEDTATYPSPAGFDRATLCVRSVWKPLARTDK